MKIIRKFSQTIILVLLCNLILFNHINAQHLVKGRIIGSDGDIPLVGAKILVDGTSTGTLSDDYGNFTLAIKQTSDKLVVSYIGYLSQTFQITSDTSLIIRLELDELKLGEVIVIGYGTQAKERVTSSISSVDQEIYEGIPEVNFQAALGAQVPGLNITQANGLPGSGVAIRIRGPSSVNADNQPLIVIDGMITNGVNGFQLGGGGYVNPLMGINPNDIESVQILKDAAASSIYGSQGANGIIIVTTKKGRFNSRAKVNIGYFAGFSEPTNYYDLLNGREFAELWNRAASVSPVLNPPTFRFDLDNQPSTDWLDLITRKGFLQSTNISVSGGSQNTQYFISASFDEEDYYYIEKGFKRFSLRANLDQIINSQLKLGFSIAPSRTQNQRVWETSPDAPLNAFAWAPNVEAFDENGKPIPAMNDFIKSNSSPLLDLLENDDQLTNTQTFINTNLSYSPLDNLTFKTDLGIEFSQSQEFLKQSNRTTSGSLFNGIGYAASEQQFSYNWTNTLQYKIDLPRANELDITLGSNLIENKLSYLFTSGNNFASNSLPYLISAANPFISESNRRGSSFIGYFIRSNYASKDKYLLTLSARVDGSSRFGKKNRYGFFPAVSGGWIVSEENFLLGSFIDFLKIRASLGVAGNAGIFDFAALSAVAPSFSYSGQPASRILQLANEELGWEKNQQWDLGIEFSIFGDRLSGVLNYYQKDSKGLLLEVPIPATNGFRDIQENIGSMRNQGFEFELSANIIQGDFNWNLSINGATLKNEVLKLSDLDSDGVDNDIIFGTQIYRIGESAASWYLPRYAGVNADNGDALFFDSNGNQVVNTTSTDRVIVGNSLPKFTGGFENSISFKALELSALFQFALGHFIYRNEGRWIEDNFSSGINNQIRNQLNAWTPSNRTTDVPELRLDARNGDQNSTRFLDPGDYLRLKNIQLSYSQPGSETNKHIRSWRFYASAQNLLTFTKFTGVDPELIGASSPAAAGLGRSFFSSPQARKLILGINVSL